MFRLANPAAVSATSESSFLENLPKATDVDAAIRRLLPDVLNARLAEMESAR